MKTLLSPVGAKQHQIARFIEEGQVTGQLEHPGVVPVHELDMDAQGNPYYTMKMVRGRTLGEIWTCWLKATATRLQSFR